VKQFYEEKKFHILADAIKEHGKRVESGLSCLAISTMVSVVAILCWLKL